MWTGNQITDEGSQAAKIEIRHLKYSRGSAEVAPVIIAINRSEDDAFDDIIKLWILKCRGFEKTKEPIILHPRFDYMMLHRDTISVNDTNNTSNTNDTKRKRM